MLFNLKSVRRFLTINLIGLVFVINIAVSANELQSATSLLQSFNSSKNSVEKREMLLSLRDFGSDIEHETQPIVNELIGIALKDISPVVVAEAAFRVGQFKLTNYSANLIKLYNEADVKYMHCGYAERIRFSIIPSLGKIGTNEAKLFLINLLRNDNGTYTGQFLLEAIKDLNDPALINDVKLYKYKMQGLIKSAKDKGLDPIVYSRKLNYIEMVDEIERVLIEKGGK